jgi:recombination protein RecR
MRVARAVTNLVEAFERLPGVGPKSAQRLTYYLLHVPQSELDKLADALKTLKTNTKECQICHNISETDPCDICSDPGRDKSVICVVEQPLDVLAFERGDGYTGVYHVLHGVIDPLHNIGPEEIKIDELMARLRQGSGEVKEIILALDPNMEGEATCMYIQKRIKDEDTKVSEVKLTRLAHGLPIGADIEYADEVTLSRALEGRREY